MRRKNFNPALDGRISRRWELHPVYLLTFRPMLDGGISRPRVAASDDPLAFRPMLDGGISRRRDVANFQTHARWGNIETTRRVHSHLQTRARRENFETTQPNLTPFRPMLDGGISRLRPRASRFFRPALDGGISRLHDNRPQPRARWGNIETIIRVEKRV